MSYLNQKTILKPISLSGLGLHSGLNVNLSLKPAEPNTGILFNKDDVLFYKKIFEKFQISIKKIMSGKYIFDFFDSNELNECEMGRKISLGFNPNEVFLIEKIVEKKGFFERFFYLFS